MTPIVRAAQSIQSQISHITSPLMAGAGTSGSSSDPPSDDAASLQCARMPPPLARTYSSHLIMGVKPLLRAPSSRRCTKPRLRSKVQGQHSVLLLASTHASVAASPRTAAYNDKIHKIFDGAGT